MAGRENDTRDSSQSQIKESKSSNKFLVGALIGGMIGVAAALLFAPRPGKELRKNLSDKTTLVGENVWVRGNELASMSKEKTALFTKSVVNKTKNLSLTDSDEDGGTNVTNYISIIDRDIKTNSKKPTKEIEVRMKIEEAKKALEEEEKKVMK
ncbi:YtxH domain-containing protein [Neobacillus sp. PS3-40]|uniref:YtxH domain-containing protein n=1 Tax=Neobacillus sp. PS3-40 TaxID=3070679 RepID=UPI0027DF0E57|nr:YtxH domain-containing protein [Neobacillus sp. PS3-40]WML45683.1 YtxH domain-containing protein [Neobacillus sp. PS3-40]